MIRVQSSDALSIVSSTGAEQIRPPISLWFPLLTGVLDVLAAAYLLSRIPKSAAAGLDKVLLLTLVYVVLALSAGAAGCLLYWRPSEVRRYRFLTLLMVASAASWVWLPAVVLFCLEGSLWAIPLLIIAAVVLAAGVRPLALAEDRGTAFEAIPSELFARTLQPIPRDTKPLKLTLCIYGAGFALKEGDIFIAALLLAICAFTATWQLIFPENDPVSSGERRRRAVARLLWHLFPAIPITFFALLLWNQNSAFPGTTHGFWFMSRTVAASTAPQKKGKKSVKQAGVGAPGFQSIILLPPPEKKDFVLLSPVRPTLTFGSLAKPLVLHFSGDYWYFQPPYHRPGPKARMSRATPLTVNVHSSNFVPLIMEAHQKLGFAFTPDCCREIRVGVKNCDKLSGEMYLGLMLADSTAAAAAAAGSAARKRPDLYLGTQPIPSSSLNGQNGCSQNMQVLTFPVNRTSSKRKFDEIKILFAVDPRRAEIGAKVAVQQFEFVPR